MNANELKISAPAVSLVAEEVDIIGQLLTLESAAVLELGCGKAEITRAIALKAGSILALEVDETQLEKNLTINDLQNVRFGHGAAEDIPAYDSSFDIVTMFKSLHHVPVERMDSAFLEISRVLKPGGFAYISEPVYAGAFNGILAIFHDERVVREAAFAAIKQAVLAQKFELVSQTFFLQPVHFESFSHFEEQVLNATHSHHILSPEQFYEASLKFNAHITTNGATFYMPMRVDLLRKN